VANHQITSSAASSVLPRPNKELGFDHLLLNRIAFLK